MCCPCGLLSLMRPPAPLRAQVGHLRASVTVCSQHRHARLTALRLGLAEGGESRNSEPARATRAAPREAVSEPIS